MADNAPRTLATLAAQAGIDLAPTEYSDTDLKTMDQGNEDLTAISVTLDTVEGFGDKYNYTLRRPSGQLGFLSLWSNIQRDATAIALMQLCQDGPVSGIRVRNAGTDKKPFWLIEPR